VSDNSDATGRRTSAGPSHITSTRNARIVAAAKLQQRRERERTGLFLVEGPNAVLDALADGIVDTVYVAGDAAPWEQPGVEVVTVDEHVVDKLATSRSPQGVVAVARRRPANLADVDGALVVLLHEVSTPGNLGTVIRTADAAGAAAVVVVGEACDPWNPKAVRAAAGSLSHLPVVLEPDLAATLAALRERGYRLLGLDADGDRDVFELETDDAPVVLVLGSEAHGLPDGLVAHLDGLVSVPTFGRAESLNLSAAAAVALYAAARGRQRALRGTGQEH
jgi:TrmH family RNA methyltransferase